MIEVLLVGALAGQRVLPGNPPGSTRHPRSEWLLGNIPIFPISLARERNVRIRLVTGAYRELAQTRAPNVPELRVSHETIYRTVYFVGHTELGPRPARHLRSGRSVRHVRELMRTSWRRVASAMSGRS